MKPPSLIACGVEVSVSATANFAEERPMNRRTPLGLAAVLAVGAVDNFDYPPITDGSILMSGDVSDDRSMSLAIDAIRGQIEAHRRCPAASEIAYVATGPTRRIADGRATPHGTVAALKAEAPQESLDDLAAWFGGGAFARIEKVSRQRTARKVRNARKARRGWR